MKNRLKKFLFVTFLGTTVILNSCNTKSKTSDVKATRSTENNIKNNEIMEEYSTKIDRVSGKNRYITSINLSKKNFNKASNIIITSGEDFPDAISSGSLSQVLNAPIILVDKDITTQEIKDEIKRLEPKKIYIVGGESKVSDEYINSLNIDFKRISGSDRYETSKEVLKEYEKINKTNADKIIIAGGENYPDALTASSLSKELHMPMLLVNGSNNEEYIEKAKYGVGSLNSLGIDDFSGKLLYGANRYETSVAVAKFLNMSHNEIIVSSGLNYPDSLVSSSMGKPIILVDDKGFTRDAIKYIGEISPEKVMFIGGENLLPIYLEDQIIGGIDKNFESAKLPTPMKSNEKGQVMILTYHDVGEEEKRYQRTPEGLKYDFLTLYKKGYLPISIKDYMSGNINIPKGYTPYVITFDDGNQNKFNILPNGEIDPDSSYALLKEVETKLEEFNPYATFFINGEIPFRQEEYVEYKFKLMIESGMDIGNHTMNHIDLKKEPEKIEEEIGSQKINLEKYTPEGYEVNTLAVPFSVTFSGEEYNRVLKGNYNGVEYNNIAVGIGGWKPDQYPNTSQYKLLPRIPGTRIDVDGYGIYDFVEYFDNNPNERYVK